jgi:hypothetical protein
VNKDCPIPTPPDITKAPVEVEPEPVVEPIVVLPRLLILNLLTLEAWKLT